MMIIPIPTTCFTKKHGFSKGQLDRSVHIDQMVCPFWLKVWGMKNTYYIWLVHLIKVTFLVKCEVENLVKMDKCPLEYHGLVKLVILNG
jgi:hypothetical protein